MFRTSKLEASLNCVFNFDGLGDLSLNLNFKEN